MRTQAAIKVHHARMQGADMERFEQEARTIARLNHPRIVRVLVLSDLVCSCILQMSEFQAHEQQINAISWTSSGLKFATASNEGTVQTWNLAVKNQINSWGRCRGATFTDQYCQRASANRRLVPGWPAVPLRRQRRECGVMAGAVTGNVLLEGPAMSEKQLSRPMWACPQCGRLFANTHQSHACSRYTLAEHLEGKPAAIVALYRQLEALIQSMGPVTILPEKIRIAFRVRMSFAAVMLKQRWIDGHVVLARRLDSPRFRRIESISPRNHVHAFRLTSPEEIDAELTAWIAEAYLVGQQQHLRSSLEEPPA